MKMTFLGKIKVSLLTLFACLMLGGTLSATNPVGIVWQADLDQAVALAEKTNRLLFIHFYGDNCPPCKRMDGEVFSDPQAIEALNRDFIAVKVHTAKQTEIAAKFGVKAIPTDIVLKPNGQMLHRRQGGISQERFVAYTAFLVDKAMKESSEPNVPQTVTSPEPVQVASIISVPAYPSQTVPTISQPTVPPPMTQENPGLRDPFTKQVVQPPPMVQPPVAAAPPVMASMPPIVPGPTMTTTPVTVPAQNPMLPPVVSAPVAPPTADSLPAAPIVTPPTPATPIATYTAPVLKVAETTFREPPPGPPSNMNEVPKTTVEVPLGLEGYCPVILSREERWVPGNPAYYTMFRGHVFRFSSEEAMAEFVKAPLNFSPVAMGEDIVQMVNRNKKVYGNRKFGVWYQGRVFLFSSQESLDAFAERPEYYAEIAIKYETAFKGLHGLF